jgi:hypothetical protein
MDQVAVATTTTTTTTRRRRMLMIYIHVHQMIVPSFTTRLAGTARQFLRRDTPTTLGAAVLVHELYKTCIFVTRPRTFHQRRFEHLVPTSLTCRLFASGQLCDNGRPIFRPPGFHQMLEQFIFALGPFARHAASTAAKTFGGIVRSSSMR